MSGELRRNIELKARLCDPAAAHAVARRLAVQPPIVELQTDTYFAVSHGRQKLREIAGGTARLVWYARPDDPQPKPSDYRLLDVSEPQRLKELFAAALGITVVVQKRRTIYFDRNVRIHLDEVADLGAFIEFEAVLGDGVDDATGHAQLGRLRREFRITDADLRARSYADLLAEKTGQSG